MNKKLKLGYIIIFAIFVLGITLFTMSNNLTKNNINNDSNINAKKFSEGDAISKLNKEHPDFPTSPSEIITRQLPTGGPRGTTANVKFSISVENIEKETYKITLTKDWGITVNGTYVKSFWIYTVTPNSIVLIDNIDNDGLPNMMK